nr:type IV toxin-antitoxin system AbiEi family antitoxin domain-containing protein [Tsukamurella sp. 1534]
MGDVVRRGYLLATGMSSAAISRAVDSGRLERLARGAYAVPAPPGHEEPPWERYRTTVLATAPAFNAVVSHESAAVLHGIPFLRPARSLVHFTVDRRHGGGVRRGAHIHPRPLGRHEIVLVDGARATSRVRTAIDVATTGDLERAVCAIDAVRLRRRYPSPDDPAPVTVAELEECLSGLGRRRGVAVARRAIELSVDCSASAGESWSRMQMLSAGIPLPRLQREHVLEGRQYFADFDWGPLIGEFDGLDKYGTTSRAVTGALAEEKAREETFAAAGIEVVRWGWRTLRAPGRLPLLLTTALARNGLIEVSR